MLPVSSLGTNAGSLVLGKVGGTSVASGGDSALTSAVIGATTIDELTSSLGAISLELDAATRARLEEIWPGPGEAPQAYAW